MLACNAVFNGILVRDLADVAPLALGQQVLQRLIVDLNEAGFQAILPALLLQPLHLIQNLQATQSAICAHQAGVPPHTLDEVA